MNPGLTFRTTLITLALASLALLAGAPSAAAQPAVPAACDPEPLGHPDPDGGLDDDVKTFGNPVIYGGCVFVLDVTGDAIQLVVDGVNLVCDFATGEPCLGTGQDS